MVLQEVQLYGAARRVQTQEGLNYFVAPKGMCELKKKFGALFWSFSLQFWSFLGFIIRKILATFDFIFFLLINTNTGDSERDRDKKKKEKITRASPYFGNLS